MITSTQAQSDGVCAKVGLRLDQTAVMTRTAFRATLELSNNDPASSLTSVSAQVEIRDAGGQIANSRFSTNAPTLERIDRVDGSGTLAAKTTAVIRWLLIPTDEAAPLSATVFNVGGQLSYILDGNQVQVPLEPVAITVHPDAALDLTYFHQRDVFSDDPFTPAIEPAQPYALAVMVKNRGAGPAKSLKITSGEPQIIDNEKGLLIDFKLVGAMVNGTNAPGTMALDFGRIDPGDIKIAEWYFTSSLQGFFTAFSATFQHEDTLGSLRLSTIKSVAVLEMQHIVYAGYQFADGKPDYLVNAVPDPEHLPDALYLSNGSTNAVQVVRQSVVPVLPSEANLQVELISPMPAGWAYLRVPEPSDGRLRLRQVRRSDGVDILLGTNVWTTDRTFIGPGQRPVRENILHLLDYNSSGSYTLIYTDITNVVTDSTAPASAVTLLPAQSGEQFAVTWSGQDDVGGSGLAYFDIFVSSNGGPFQVWLQQTTLQGAIYEGTKGSTYSFYSLASDQAGNREQPPGGADAQTTVTLVNTAPVLAALPSVSIDEGETLVLIGSATDADLPANNLTFSLAPGAPSGMTINPSSGGITWPTSELDGPGTNVVTVRVTDNGQPSFSDSKTFTVVVREVNRPPTLAAIANETVSEGSLLTINCQANDLDLPPNQLTFSLGPGAPTGTTINPISGVFSWQPDETQGPSTNGISVIVTDNGTPSLGATQFFQVVVQDVLPDLVVSLGRTNLMAGESGVVPVALSSTLDLTQVSFQIGAGSRLANLTLQPTAAEVTSATLQSAGSDTYAASLTLNPALRTANFRKLADLAFLAVPDLHSVIEPLTLSPPVGQRSGGEIVTQTAGVGGRVIIVAAEPVLDIGAGPILTLYGHPGANYGLEHRTNLVTAPWIRFNEFTLGDRFASITNAPAHDPMTFYRAYEFPAFGLTLQSLGGPVFSLTLSGDPGASYIIQTATNLSSPTNWSDLYSVTLTNTVESFYWTNTGATSLYFRAVKQ